MMTEEQVVQLLRNDGSKLNRARRVFSGCRAKIDNAARQRRALSPIEMRRMEFEAVEAIAKELGLDLSSIS